MSPVERPAEGSWRIAIDAEPAEVEELLEEVIAAWAGEKNGQELDMAVIAGLRHGSMKTRVTLTRARGGTVVMLEHISSHYRLDVASTFFLGIAALAGLGTLILPFVRALWSVLPVLLVILVSAWFFIVARLKSSGPEDFLLELKKVAENPAK